MLHITRPAAGTAMAAMKAAIAMADPAVGPQPDENAHEFA
jgi:hypothetical protein